MEYISREDALKSLCEYCQEKETCDRHSHWNGRCTEYADIDAIPAADVFPVVRCKDCLAYESADGFCYVHADHMNEDDFCSKGTKRE